MLPKIPLLLEGLLQACVSVLRVSVRRPRNICGPVSLVLNFISKPIRLCPHVPNVTPEVPAPYHNGHAPNHEWYLGAGYIVIRDDQDALGWIWEVPMWGSPLQKVVQVCLYVVKGCSDPASSAYHGFVTCRCAAWISLIIERTPSPYVINSSWYPWVDPYFLKKK